jgi:hypothetical protein
MPNLSFAGHLSGIASGTLQLYGMLNVLIPSESYLMEMDDRNSLRWLSSRPSFVPTTSIQDTTGGNPLSMQQSASRGIRLISTCLANILKMIKVAVFGQSRAANSNIQLDSLWCSQPLTESTEDGKDWGDLPRVTTSQIV